MGKATGFLEYDRKVGENIAPLERIKDFKEFHQALEVEEQKLQGARCMDCGIPFCQSGVLIKGAASGCPLNNLIPEFNDLVYKGNFKVGLQRLLKTNPFPEFTGRVCPAPCEAACTVSINGPAVAIKENERYIIDKAFEEGYISSKEPLYRTESKIAVVGSGPAGLAAAYKLNKFGHKVTVYEREDRIGGLLMYGIPNMKLDKAVIDRRVQLMKEEGITFVTNANVGADKELTNKVISDYDAVVMATGASKPRDLNVKGRELKGVHFAVDFLKVNTKSLLDSNLTDNNYVNAKGKNVLVVGGGDTGTDCVGTSLRHGCNSVIQLEITDKLSENRLPNNPWPEWARVLKTDYGQEEYIAKFGEDPRRYLTSVKELIGNDKGEVEKAIIVDIEWKKLEDGRVIPSEVPGSEKEIQVDLVLLAMGFLGSEEYLKDNLGLEFDNRGNIKSDYLDFKTNKEKIFSCGDARRGQSLVVWAIREGMGLADRVDVYLTK